MSAETDDPRGYLPLTPQQFHILLSLTEGESHGYAVLMEIAARTGGALRLGTGTLYTALGRLLTLGLVGESERRDADPRRRYYRLTPLGRAVLRAETARLLALLRDARRKGIQPLRPALQRPRA